MPQQQHFQIWYMKNDWFRQGIVGTDPSSVIELTHTPVAVIEVQSIGEVFTRMQAENWSPNGEARYLIAALGLSHTSLCTGDIAIDSAGGIHICRPIGWELIGQLKD